MIQELSDANFQEVVTIPGAVLVDFWAEWCGPCRRLHAVLEEVAAEYSGRVRVGRLDVAANPVVPAREGVLNLPTLILYQGGRAVARWGALSRQQLRRNLERHLAATLQTPPGRL